MALGVSPSKVSLVICVVLLTHSHSGGNCAAQTQKRIPTFVDDEGRGVMTNAHNWVVFNLSMVVKLHCCNDHNHRGNMDLSSYLWTMNVPLYHSYSLDEAVERLRKYRILWLQREKQSNLLTGYLSPESIGNRDHKINCTYSIARSLAFWMSLWCDKPHNSAPRHNSAPIFGPALLYFSYIYRRYAIIL